ncbi:hypothetical protein A2153_04500 [Candidatus Gottesmanbacteria bacterium RBG_16_38_7b]|uniref:ABC transporter domain-containing protein n=2 Tax=Candidatus Gottesmaniibacteriota TaxID=1752720 RepID=A0A1F5YHX9_9BACT|nr:MAG: hypothetical protein A2153_04500 [Candidatus Gottesmanbacteria bacterium RBG_16_38_7b]OGG31002.1 MAG: hypothetical protein A3I51_06110 [Candidatus Gottesmanbacteria bacterium RIFCSPLOWO2_02_FULL_38_8]
MSNKISINNLTFSYGKDRKILQNVSIEIKKGSFLGISGVNGSGKTTFTYLLNGLIPQFIKGTLLGEVYIDDLSTKTNSIASLSKKVGMVFQNPDFSIFNLTVKEEIEFGLRNLNLNNQSQRIKKALDLVGLTGYLEKDPQTLSFGEKQKVCLAAVLSLDTPYIVLDEPSASLDFKSSLELYNLLKNLNIKGKTIIVVEHDTDFLWRFAKEVLVLDQGRIVLYGDVTEVKKRKNILYKLGIKT